MSSGHQSLKRVVRTDAGMCAIWQTDYFVEAAGQDGWDDDWSAEEEFLTHAITAGAIVPVGVGGDGAFEILIRWGEAAQGLTEREGRHVIVSSDPYLLKSAGAVYVGGLEEAGDLPGRDANRIALPDGRYSVVVYLIDWKAEPGSMGVDGRPMESALPDFVVEIRPERHTGETYRTKSATFERPSS